MTIMTQQKGFRVECPRIRFWRGGCAFVLMLGVAMALPFLAWSGEEFFVDAQNGNDAYDGRSAVWTGEARGPKRSIQAAVELAQVGSTAADMNVVTLAPGDYTNGEHEVTNDGVTSLNRVVISNPIHLRSARMRGSRDVTRIVGRWDFSGSGETSYFMGPKAVRCVWVKKSAAGTRLEGISFVNGASAWGGDGKDHDHSTGGGGVVYDNYEKADMYVIDCAFKNCLATRGGGLYNGTAVRCLFTSCRASKYGSAARSCALYNCVLADNPKCPGSTAVATFCYSIMAVNCTFVGNELGGLSTPSRSGDSVYNCISVLNAGGGIDDYTAQNCVVNSTAKDNEIFSPATGDYRLSAGATSLTEGSAAWLSKIPEEFRDKDYYGNPRTTDGVVYVGAVQAFATPVGGKISIAAPSGAAGVLSLDDHVCWRNNLYEQGETWPRSVKIAWTPKPETGTDVGLVRYKKGDAGVQWPLADGSAWVLAPQEGNDLYAAVTGSIVYVDPQNGSDAELNDGSVEKPWKTLQKAVTRDDSAHALIIAREGDYNSSGAFDTTWQDVANRVLVSTKASIRVVAEKGPDETFITGAADLVTPVDGNAYGIGPSAVRCVAVQNGACCAFQGFTLRDGHSSMKSGDGDCLGAHGAAFLNGYDDKNYKGGWLLDCVVANCVASRGAAAYGGIAERTLFADNQATRLGVFRYAELRSCLVRGNKAVQQAIFADISEAYNTTFVTNFAYVIGNADIYNCVVAHNSTTDISVSDARTRRNSIYGRADPIAGEEMVKDAVGFADAVGGDYRLNSASAAVGLGTVICLRSAMDFTGRPFEIAADGRVAAGAFSAAVPGVRVAPSEFAGTKTSTLYVFGDADAVDVTLPATSLNGRALCGYEAGGVTQTVSSATVSISKTQAIEGAPFVMNPIYLSHFYVSVDGDDGNTGGSETTAFKTLAKASEIAQLPGDVVTVLPGTYDDKTIKVGMDEHGWGKGMQVLCRLAVFPGVTFESRDGAAATVVKGASAVGEPGVDVDEYGCGKTGAVRCAYVGNNGVLRGFTLLGGRTNNGNLPVGEIHDVQGVDYSCAGVLGPYSDGAALVGQWSSRIVENCIFDDCYSPRAAAARYVLLRNCKITNCRGVNVGPVVRECRLEGCLMVGNLSDQIYNCQLFDCTSDTYVGYGSGYAFPVVNSAFVKKATQKAGAFTNCAFKTGTVVDGSNVNPLMADDFGLDESFCPTAISPLCDAGDRTLMPEGTVTDLRGSQRVYNAQVDIGCFERDCRPDYATALGTRRLTVDAADCDVTKINEKTVALPKGELSVTLSSPVAPKEATFAFTAQVTGTGVLTVMREGSEEPLAVFTQGAPQRFSFDSSDAATRLAFSYEPGEDDQGAALLSGFRYMGGLVFVVR